MKKIAVVYWSGGGNTEAMAKAAVEGVKKAGGDAALFRVDAFSAQDMKGYDGFLFGCPAMGAEVLEEAEFEPFFQEAETKISGVPVGLFGSYGWGGGEWMRQWEARVKDDGARLIGQGLAVENAPDEKGLAECAALGEALVKALT